jgi:molecular chaperone HscB
MTYFELFEIPVQLKVNTALLSKKFFELSKKYHPDYFANESEEIQAEVLEKSALLNKAWKTFQSTDATIKYVLQEKGLLEEEEKYELPPDFLMEVMDINEALMDADGLSVTSSLQITINNLQSDIYEPVKETVENYQDNTATEKELLQVKAYYYKKKYLDRIRQQLAGMA